MHARTLAAAAAAVSSLSFSLSSPALASTVGVTSGQLLYAAEPAETNQLSIEEGATSLLVTDPGATIAAGTGCTAVSSTRVQCALSGVTSLSVTTRDQDDLVRVTSTRPTTVSAGAGVDDVVTGSGADTVDLGPEESQVALEQERAETGAGGDRLTARNPVGATLGSGADTATLLMKRASNSIGTSVSGGSEDDTLDASASFDPAVILAGDAGNDTLRASKGGSELAGGDGVDTLIGGAGNDKLIGGAGSDSLTGGAGADIASYTDQPAGVTVTADNVANDGRAGETENVRSDIETLVGGSGNDTLTASVDADRPQLLGCGGADTLNGTARDDVLAGDDNSYVLGVSGCPSATTPGADQLKGNGGDDILGNIQGADAADGGAGRDIAAFGHATTNVVVTLDDVANDGVAGQGANIRSTVEDLRGGSANDTLTGSGADNTLAGGPGQDTLNAGAGDDRLCGGDLNTFFVNFSPECSNAKTNGDLQDTLNGGVGDDTLQGGTGADVYNGGAGADVASFVDVTVVSVRASNDGVANDGITSQAANVRSDVEGIVGGSGSDTLTGGAGNDVLNGGSGGNDTLTGGLGNDLLLGGTVNQSGPLDGDVFNGGGGVDTVSYADHTPSASGIWAVTVTLDGLVDDGFDSEADNVKGDVENVVGTQGDDDLTGTALANKLLGRGGADTLRGLGGNDVLDGGPGFDELFGGDGVDDLFTRDGITGETADCGAGTTDRAVTDTGDIVTGCESNSTGATAASTIR